MIGQGRKTRKSSEYGRFVNRGAAYLVALISLTFVSLAGPVQVAEANSRYAAIVVDGETGKVLFARNADKPRYPASLTKIMTLYLTFEALEEGRLTLSTPMIVSKRAMGQPPSNLCYWRGKRKICLLREGDKISVEDAIKLLVTKSANDVATVLSEQLGGTEYNFTIMMNKKAKELGMRRSRFMNASGLPNRKQKSTARDMAILSMAIAEHYPTYYEYFKTPRFTFKGKTFKSHNKLLKGFQGTDGIKTGYTRASGFNLTTSVHRDGVHLIGVVLGGKSGNSRDTHMKQILNRTFTRVKGDPGIMPRLALVPMPRHKPQVFDPRAGSQGLMVQNTQSSGRSYSVATARSYARNVPDQGDAGLTLSGWGIQIGAWQAADTARSSLISAIGNVPEYLSREISAIMPIELGRETLYRARFGPMSWDQAHDACLALKRQNISCFEVNEPDWPEVAHTQ